MTFPTLASTSSGDLTSGTPQTLTLPSGIVPGDLILGLISDGSSPNHTWPAGWTEILDVPACTIGWRIADGAEGTTVDVANNLTGGRNAVYVMYRFSGGSFLTPLLASATFGSSAAADCPNLAPPRPQSDVTWAAIVMCNNTSADNAGSWPTNYSDNRLRYANAGGGLNGVIIVSTRNLNTASEDPSAYPILGVGGRAITLGIALERPRSSTGFIG